MIGIPVHKLRYHRYGLIVLGICCLLGILAGCSPGASGTSGTGGAPVINRGPENTHPSQTQAPVSENDSGYFYFSYDDSASLAAADLAKYLLGINVKPAAELGRAYEFLSAEAGAGAFEHFNPQPPAQGSPFLVSMGAWPRKQNNVDIYELGIKVSGPVVDKTQRANVVLTILLDVSGSMGDLYSIEAERKTLLDVAKQGLQTMHETALKSGDIINLVTFSTTASIALEGFAHDGIDSTFTDTVAGLREGGSTNLNAGIELAYAVAQRHFDASKSNRVIMLTDAYANTGEVDALKISTHTRINDAEGILFSGVGIGWNFNEAFLNVLTDEGKGAYFSMVSPLDAQRIFSDRFIALIHVAVRNVRFRLDYPPQLTHMISAAEQVSTDAAQVKSSNFSYNTAQFFLEGFEVTDALAAESQIVKLTIEYEDGNGGTILEETQKTVGELLANGGTQITDAFLVRTLAMLIGGQSTCADAAAAIEEGRRGFESAASSTNLASQYVGYIQTYCRLP